MRHRSLIRLLQSKSAHLIFVYAAGPCGYGLYRYPAEMRATRDLLRRRMYLTWKRAELLTHVQNTNSQYNVLAIGTQPAYQANRAGAAERVPEPAVQKRLEVDRTLLNSYDRWLTDLELALVQTAKAHEAQTFHRPRSIPGIGTAWPSGCLPSMISAAAPGSRHASPTVGLLNRPKTRPAHALEPRARRLARLPASGPSRKPPCYACATTPRASSTARPSRGTMARAQP